MTNSTVLSVLALCVAFTHEPLHPQAKELPIAVAFRKSILQGSYVLQIQSVADDSLKLWLLGKGKETSFILPPRRLEEFGWAQGYRFDANNLFTIGGDGFDTLRQRMPNVELNPVKFDFAGDGGLAISLSQSYLQERLPKFVKLPIKERASNTLEVSLEEYPNIVLEDGSERIHSNAILQASFLSGKIRFPLATSVSFVPSYSKVEGEVIATQIQIDDINVNVPGSSIGLLPEDWRAEATKVVNAIIPIVFSKLVLYRIERQWQKKLLNSMNFRAKVVDGRLELVVL